MEGETVVGYFHVAAKPNYPEGSLGEQPIYYEGKEVGHIDFTPDGHGNVKMRLEDLEGRVQELGTEKDRTRDELEE
ncbi:hypothetical protein QA601_03835 [Chitinispirillales bacterium ANBcel5]|uniref:hypothetical protein n=1 Tax=Cellulosispirillum alkaliphilum TaxID=3039283 RepID=UPI002A540A8C|nr:hypothetical protein [Chitinispirillales bacterium ANBcel5]